MAKLYVDLVVDAGVYSLRIDKVIVRSGLTATEAEELRRSLWREVAAIKAEDIELDSVWEPICEIQVPEKVRWDTPRRNAGQIVEVSYGDFGSGGADSTSPYKRVTDRSTRKVRYYRRAS